MPIVLIFLLGLIAPRVVLVALWLLTDLISRAFQTALWPLLGVIFMPFTTLAYAFAVNVSPTLTGGWLALVVVAALVDLGALAGGTRRRALV